VTTPRRTPRLAEWVERWNAPLTRFLGRRLPAHVDAEDLAQEVYVRLLRVGNLENIAEPRAYLYHVARNIAAEWRTRHSRQQAHSAEELDDLIELTTPETRTEQDLEAQQLDQALRCLPPMVRAVAYLKLRGGQTHEEIARHLAISPRMVRKHLTVAYAALRRLLVRERER
jgi:RNA polymerase sigma-70 factor (ECF subfamily)